MPQAYIYSGVKTNLWNLHRLIDKCHHFGAKFNLPKLTNLWDWHR